MIDLILQTFIGKDLEQGKKTLESDSATLKLNISIIFVFVTVAVNREEYCECFEANSFNKKHKNIKKGSPGLDFENCTNKVFLVNDCDFFQKP